MRQMDVIALAVSVLAFVAVFALLAVESSVGHALISSVFIGSAATVGVAIRRRLDRR